MIVTAEVRRCLSVPCYIFRVGSKEYLVDAYFIKFLEFPPRRSLLILPPTGYDIDVAPDSLVLRDANDFSDVAKYLLEAYEVASSRIVKEAVSTFKKFRISFLIPASWIRQGIDDEVSKECVGAAYVLEGVFGREQLIKRELRIASHSKVFVHVCVTVAGGKAVFTSRNERVARTYEWLLENDGGFRRALSKVLGVELSVNRRQYEGVDLRRMLKL